MLGQFGKGVCDNTATLSLTATETAKHCWLWVDIAQQIFISLAKIKFATTDLHTMSSCLSFNDPKLWELTKNTSQIALIWGGGS